MNCCSLLSHYEGRCNEKRITLRRFVTPVEVAAAEEASKISIHDVVGAAKYGLYAIAAVLNVIVEVFWWVRAIPDSFHVFINRRSVIVVKVFAAQIEFFVVFED